MKSMQVMNWSRISLLMHPFVAHPAFRPASLMRRAVLTTVRGDTEGSFRQKITPSQACSRTWLITTSGLTGLIASERAS